MGAKQATAEKKTEVPGGLVALADGARVRFGPIIRRISQLRQERRQRAKKRAEEASLVREEKRRERKERAARRALRISEHASPPKTHNTRLVPVDKLNVEFHSGMFDRKPSKQRGWNICIAPSGQSDFWCLYDTHGLDIDSSVQFGKTVELRATKDSKIFIGADVVMADRCIVQAGELVEICCRARVGLCSLIMDRNHHGLGKDAEIIQAVYIGEGAVIGEHCVVLAGSVVQDGQVVEPFSVVTSRGIIRPPCNLDFRLIPVDYERQLRLRMAYLEPAQDLDAGDMPHGSRRSIAYPGVGVVDLRSIRAAGRLENIRISKYNTNFYHRPWGASLFVATGPHTVMMGAHTFVHHSTQFHATGGSIIIGESTIISWRVAMLTSLEGLESADILIEAQCWVSANTIILPGSHIGRGCVIGAGSVVQGVFPPWSIIAGHPAEVKGALEPFEGAHGSSHHAL